jgi:betaine-aldehyde dehydrogenase
MLDNYVAGQLVAAKVDVVTEVFDPSTGLVYDSAPESGCTDVAAACAAAAEAFASWSRTTPAARSRLLHSVAALLEAHGDELTSLEVRDTGKPRHLMAGEELPAVVDVVSYFAGACRTLEGAAAGEYLDGVTSAVRREPIGVCAQVTPWNYPLMMAVWKWVPAVAAGNTVVLKPSELTPASTLRMAQLCGEILPPGVLNVVLGGASTGDELVRQSGVAMISLTGSPRAGRAVAGRAAERLARSHLELGGNAPVVVFEDADLSSAAEAVVGAGFYNAGQDCTAATRVLVHESVRGELLDLLVSGASAVVTGDPDDVATTYGPLISSAHLERVAGFLSRLDPGASVVTGGRRVDRPGYFFEPTIVAGVRQEAEIVQEEVFGPVVTVQGFSGDAEALAMANGVEQGLTASVWTSDVARAGRFCRDLDFGAVSVNTHAPMASEMPHGGFGTSGYGKDLSVYGLLDYTRVKHVAHAW